MGDLNCEPDDEPMELLKVNLEDTYNSVGTVTYGPVGTFNEFNTEMLLQRRKEYILVKNIEVKEYRRILMIDEKIIYSHLTICLFR